MPEAKGKSSSTETARDGVQNTTPDPQDDSVRETVCPVFSQVARNMEISRLLREERKTQNVETLRNEISRLKRELAQVRQG